MDTYGTDRLEAKDVESAIVAKIVEDFNLTPILAKAHYVQMVGYFGEYRKVPTQSGEIYYLAVAATEPAGKPLRTCQMVEVRLALTDPSDLRVLREHGLAGMRRRRIARLARQARIQGALLTVEDLAFIVTSSTATIKRHIAWLRDTGEQIPTRGQIRDIGPGVSHKTKIVQLWLWGYQLRRVPSSPAASICRALHVSTGQDLTRPLHLLEGRHSRTSGWHQVIRPVLVEGIEHDVPETNDHQQSRDGAHNAERVPPVHQTWNGSVDNVMRALDAPQSATDVVMVPSSGLRSSFPRITDTRCAPNVVLDAISYQPRSLHRLLDSL